MTVQINDCGPFPTDECLLMLLSTRISDIQKQTSYIRHQYLLPLLNVIVFLPHMDCHTKLKVTMDLHSIALNLRIRWMKMELNLSQSHCYGLSLIQEQRISTNPWIKPSAQHKPKKKIGNENFMASY